MADYARKVRKIKKIVKDLVVETSAIVDRIAEVQSEINTTKREREFCLRKLIEFEPIVKAHELSETKYKRKYSDTNSESSMKPLGKKTKVANQQPKKAQYKLPIIFTNENITVHNFGKIIFDRPGFHTESVIYPVNYKISRVFNGINYFCVIHENNREPLFEIYQENDRSVRFVGSTTDDVHSEFLQACEESSIIVPDGDQFFGLRLPKILEFLKQMANVKKLTKFNKTKKENFFFDDNARFMSPSLTDHLF